MKNTSPREKAFTLLELVITMGLTLMMLTMVSSFLIVIVKNSQKSNQDNAIYTEINVVRTRIDSWVAKYSGVYEEDLIYTYTSVYDMEKSALEVKENGSQVATLSYNRNSNTITSTDDFSEITLEYVDDIIFECKGNAIIMHVYYDNAKPYIVVLGLGVAM